MKNASELSRTQIYLTQHQQARLAQVSRGSAETKSALIRQAVDLFLAQQPKLRSEEKTQYLQNIAGLWAGREDWQDPAVTVRKMRQGRFSTTAG